MSVYKQKKRNSEQLRALGISASVSEVAACQQEIRESLLLLKQMCSVNLFNSIQQLKIAAVKAKDKSTKKIKKKKELIAQQRPRKRRLHLSSQRSCNESWPKSL